MVDFLPTVSKKKIFVLCQNTYYRLTLEETIALELTTMSPYNISSINNHNKISQEGNFASVRRYLRDSPFGMQDAAIQAALAGLDAAQQKFEREQKLVTKFANTNASTGSSSNDQFLLESDTVQVKRPTMVGNRTTAALENPNMEEDEWLDVAEPIDETNESSSAMAQHVVKILAENSVQCHGSIAALAVAVHALLIATGFSCTGIPESKAPISGFAAPTRPLKEFLPANWESSGLTRIFFQFRYRKFDTGAVVLTVQAIDESISVQKQGTPIVQINISSNSTQDSFSTPVATTVSVPLKEYLNLDSWRKATDKHKVAAPILHYKNLSGLLSRLAQSLDLGGDTNASQHLYVDYTLLKQQPHAGLSTRKNAAIDRVETMTFPRNNDHQPPFSDPMQIPQHRHPDFSGDLLPSGIGLRRPSWDAICPGNLMGPNHPVFGISSRYMGPSHPSISGGNTGIGTLRPRFDPFGPPGGPVQGDDNSAFQNDPNAQYCHNNGGTGVPNNDLARPPPLPNNNMFM